MVGAKIGKKIGRAGPDPKFCILFRTGPGPGRNFHFSSGRAQIAAMKAQPGPEKSGPFRPLYYTANYNKIGSSHELHWGKFGLQNLMSDFDPGQVLQKNKVRQWPEFQGTKNT